MSLFQSVNNTATRSGGKSKTVLFLLFVLSGMASGALLLQAEDPQPDGSPDHPWEVATLEDLSYVASGEYRSGGSWDPDDHYRQTADIDASATAVSGSDLYNQGAGWKPIASSTSSFSGVYDGAGHQITGLFIDRPQEQEVGLFGSVRGAEISNLVLKEPDITGGDKTGGLVGAGSDGTLLSKLAVVRGAIRGGEDVGGLAGQHSGGGKISNSYFTGAVTGFDRVGGLIGSAQSADGNMLQLEKSYAAAGVTSDDQLGGLAASGEVEVSDAFWDTEVADAPNISQGGTGTTTEAMQRISTYTDTSTDGLEEAWDMEVPASYDDETWYIEDGSDHPRLRSEWDPFLALELKQRAFRFFENNDDLRPSFPLGGENETAANIRPEEVIRLRVSAEVTAGGLAPEDELELELQYAAKTADSCREMAGREFSSLGDPGSDKVWRGFENGEIADGTDLADALLSDSTQAFTYNEQLPTADRELPLNSGEVAEWDLVLENNGAESGRHYCFRLVYSDGTELQEYDSHAELRVRRGLSQVNYRFREDDGGE